MIFSQLLDDLIRDTLDVSVPAFAAELVVCATIVALLLGRLFGTDRVIGPRWVALAGAVASFLVTLPQVREAFFAGRSPVAHEVLFRESTGRPARWD